MIKGSHHTDETKRFISEGVRATTERGKPERFEFYTRIRKKIKARRQSLGMSIRTASTLAGIHQNQWYKFETGKNVNITFQRAYMMCLTLRMRLSDLVPIAPKRHKRKMSKKVQSFYDRYVVRKGIPQWKYYQKDIIRMRAEGMSLPKIKKALGLTSDKAVQMALSEEFRERVFEQERIRSKTSGKKRKLRLINPI